VTRGSPVRPDPSIDRRAVTPAVGVVLLVALTVVLAAAVGAAALGTAGDAPDPGEAGTVALSLSVDAATDRLTLVHRAGAPLDARQLRVRIRVAGTPLEHQPPVPFFAARGFRAGPTGPFNPAADPRWTAGERASLRLASTNAPGIDSGDRVVVEVTVDDRRVATLSGRG
jgi:flagellin-like protein